MCGINGIIDFKNPNPSLLTQIGAMNVRLAHRGPDDHGSWHNPDHRIFFGHTRLSILDLSEAGHQPMRDKDTGNCLVFNGEIFNYRELNAKYLADEHFQSSSDTETILKLYRKMGLGMLSLLNGMFAFALWDESAQELVFARDVSGKKPLYFTEKGGKFSFASEIKALLTLPWVKATLDESAAYDFFTYNQALTPATLFEGIEKFRPSHVLRLNKNGIQHYGPFRELKRQVLQITSEEALADELYEKLDASVQLRMLADVPVGLFLSGGVDSSAILASMSNYSSAKIASFTIGFENQEDYNELQYAEQMAKRFGTEHHVQLVKKQDLLDFLPTITSVYDEPQADTTAIPIHFIAKLAQQQGIKVLLNGDGADELFAGYSSYLKYANAQKKYEILSKLPGWAKKAVNGAVSVYKPDSALHELSERLVKSQELFWPGAAGVKESQKKALLGEDFRNRNALLDSYHYVQELQNDYKAFSGKETKEDYINWMCYGGYRSAVTERFLFRADRLGMANSVETRSPFLDVNFVEWALSIPGSWKIKNGVTKYILKKSLEQSLPPEILYRKKMGFCLPLQEWAGEVLIDDLERNLPLFCKETGIFDEKTIQNQLKWMKNGKSDFTNRIWTVYFFMHWYKKWMS